MELLLFVIYLLLFTWLIPKVRFIRSSGITPLQIRLVYLMKVLAGICYGWIGINYNDIIQMGDTWRMHFHGIDEYANLKQHPVQFFTEIFRNNYPNGYLRIFSGHDSWWSDLDYNILIKLEGIINLFTNGSYFTNVLFFNFLTLFGAIGIFRTWKNALPGKEAAAWVGCFIAPSFVYWSSGLHKDGLIFTGIAAILYTLYFHGRALRWQHILTLLIASVVVIALRNYLFLLLIPAIAAWWLAKRFPGHRTLAVAGFYLLGTGLILALPSLLPGRNPLQLVVDKQADFKVLRGHSRIHLAALEPTAASFIRIAPQAMTNAAIRPFPSDAGNLPGLVNCIEVMLIWVLVAAALFHRQPHPDWNRPFILCCVAYAVSVLLVIGFTVNFLGAIVRYRSLVIPLILPPLVAMALSSKLARSLN